MFYWLVLGANQQIHNSYILLPLTLYNVRTYDPVLSQLMAMHYSVKKAPKKCNRKIHSPNTNYVEQMANIFYLDTYQVMMIKMSSQPTG